MAEWWRRLLFLPRLRRFADDLDAELRFHLDMRARALENDGWSPIAAERQARAELGRPLQIRERSRDVWVIRPVDQLGQDLRCAWRACRRQPAFAAAVVATLALGIGANTAIFSVVDTLLLRPAPFADPGRLVLVQAARPAQQQPRLPLSYPNFLDLRGRSRAFDGLAGWTINEVTVSGGAAPEHVQSALATSNLFEVLGVRALVGRTFEPREDRPGIAPVVVISHGLWSRRFGRDSRAIGTPLLLDGEPYEVVGVLPENFRFASYPHETEVWLPFGLDKFTDRKYVRGLNSILAIGRLRKGTSAEEAQRDVAATAASLERDYADSNRGRLMFVVPFAEQATSRVRWALVGLSAGVVLVLLIACVNVMNLLLSRATARQHELAVRSALGGSRRRIAAQLLVEYLVLALAGGVAGLPIAVVARGVLVGLPYNTPDLFTPWVASLDAPGLDARVLLFAFLSSLLVGMLVGGLPALQAPASGARALAAAGARISSHRRTMRLRSGLVVAEVALAVVLLTATGLMITTIGRLGRIDPGFRPEGLTAIDLNLSGPKYAAEGEAIRFYHDLVERLEETPGVETAGAVEYLPFSGLDADTGVLFEGEPVPVAEKRPRVHYRTVTPHYFRTMGIHVTSGRTFGSDDPVDGVRVAVLNETAARRLFPDVPHPNRRVALDFEAMQFFPDRPPVFDLDRGLREVVGMVKDVRHSGLADEAEPELYVPLSQHSARRMTLVVRSGLSPGAVLAAVRQLVSSLDPVQPVGAATTLSDLIAASLSRPRFNTTLMTAFGFLALGLAAIGIYGVMAYFVELRTREIGVHIAIGATRADVCRLITRQMIRLALTGIAIGLAVAIGVGAALSRFLAGIDFRDPVVPVAVAASVLAVALVATAIPVIRAMRIDPARALRTL